MLLHPNATIQSRILPLINRSKNISVVGMGVQITTRLIEKKVAKNFVMTNKMLKRPPATLGHINNTHTFGTFLCLSWENYQEHKRTPMVSGAVYTVTFFSKFSRLICFSVDPLYLKGYKFGFVPVCKFTGYV